MFVLSVLIFLVCIGALLLLMHVCVYSDARFCIALYSCIGTVCIVLVMTCIGICRHMMPCVMSVLNNSRIVSVSVCLYVLFVLHALNVFHVWLSICTY